MEVAEGVTATRMQTRIKRLNGWGKPCSKWSGQKWWNLRGRARYWGWMWSVYKDGFCQRKITFHANACGRRTVELFFFFISDHS